MTDVELLVLNSNTGNHLTVQKKKKLISNRNISVR